jgi:predicted AAA+ superfamily ATPase
VQQRAGGPGTALKHERITPKLYIRDAGIANCLLGINNMASLQGHPKLGAIWEGYAMEQVIIQKKASRNSYFWATHAGAELDLLIIENGRRLGYEFKYSDSPGITRSIRQTIKDLALDEVTIVYPGSASYPLDANIQVKPLHDPSL